MTQPNYLVSEARKEIPQLLPSSVRAVGVVPGNVSTKSTYQRDTTASVCYLVELPPARKTLIFSEHHWYEDHRTLGQDRMTGPHTGDVAMPWQYFIFVMSYSLSYERKIHYSGGYYTHVLWSRERLKSLDEQLMIGCVPDIEPIYNGMMCLGSLSRGAPREPDGIINHVLRGFFGGAVSTPLHRGWHLPSVYPTLGDWINASEDPLVYLNWPDWKTRQKVDLRIFFPKET